MSFDSLFLLRLILGGIASYLIGSVNPAIIISEKIYGDDIRSKGSGNAGMTNSFRVMGKKGGFMVMACDLAKGVIGVLVGWLIAGSAEGKIVAALCLIIGHCFPVYFGFRGGKGVLSTAGVFLMLDWRMALSAIGLFLVVLLICKMVSVSSMLAALSLMGWSWVYGHGMDYVIISALIAMLLIFMHRSNIKRIINRSESKVNIFGRGKAK